MGFFNNSLLEGVSYKESTFDNILNDPVEPSSEYLEFDEAALVAVAESEENYNAIIRSIGIAEATYFAHTGKEMVYTEGVLSNIFSKLKAFLKKVWEKIKALFKRFVMMFDKYSKDDKSFLKKYEKAVRRASGEEIEFKGYPFSEAKLKDFEGCSVKLSDAKIKNTSVSKIDGASFDRFAHDCKDVIDQVREDPESFYDELRGVALNTNESISSSDFTKELFEATHGSSSKESLDGKDLSAETNLTIIATTKDRNKALKKNYDAVDKLINKVLIKNVESLEKQNLKESTAFTEDIVYQSGKPGRYEKDGKSFSFDNGSDASETKSTGSNGVATKDEKAHAASFLLNVFHTISSIATQINGALLTAYKDQNRQARSICAKYIAKGKTYNAVGESTSYSGSFLADVKFK